MFRINRTSENSLTLLVKVVGAIGAQDLQHWGDSLQAILQHEQRQVIFDFCDITRMRTAAIEKLQEAITNRVSLLNGAVALQNIMRASGHSAQILDCGASISALTAGPGRGRSPRRPKQANLLRDRIRP